MLVDLLFLYKGLKPVLPVSASPGHEIASPIGCVDDPRSAPVTILIRAFKVQTILPSCQPKDATASIDTTTSLPSSYKHQFRQSESFEILEASHDPLPHPFFAVTARAT
jgi:hypothetical protein